MLPWTIVAPSASISRSASIAADGSGPFITRSPATITASGFSFLIALRTASSAVDVAVDVASSDRPSRERVIGSDALRGGMMKLSVASQATSPSTLATPRPRPNREPSLSIVTSSRRTSPGTTIRLNRVSSMPANSPIRSPNPGCFAT